MSRANIQSRESRFGAGALALLCCWMWVSGRPCRGAEANAVADDAVSVRMLHVFIQADVNNVRIENIWVFARATQTGSWKAELALPEGAELLELDEPGQSNHDVASATVGKTMAADSLIDSLGFSYLLDNKNGRCTARIPLAYAVESAVVSVSGPGTRVSSNALKPDAFRSERTTASRVYSGGNLPASSEMIITLTGLPQRDSPTVRTLALGVLALIFGAAAATMAFGSIQNRAHEQS